MMYVYYEDEDIGVSAAVITEYTENGTGKLKLSLSSKGNTPDSQISFGSDGIKLIKADNSMVMTVLIIMNMTVKN